MPGGLEDTEAVDLAGSVFFKVWFSPLQPLPKAAGAAASGSSLEIKILRPTPDLLNQRLKVRLPVCVLARPPGDSGLPLGIKRWVVGRGQTMQGPCKDSDFYSEG